MSVRSCSATLRVLQSVLVMCCMLLCCDAAGEHYSNVGNKQLQHTLQHRQSLLWQQQLSQQGLNRKRRQAEDGGEAGDEGDAGDSGDDMDLTISDQCTRDITVYMNALQQPDKIWAQRMQDSWGKEESGVHSGNFAWVGDRDQCLRVRPTQGVVPTYWEALGVVTNETHDFHTQFCMGFYRRLDLGGILFSQGFCFPDSCSHKDMQNFLALPILDDGVPDWMYCGEKPALKDDAGAVVAIVILSVFLTIIVSASGYDVITYHLLPVVRSNKRKYDLSAQQKNDTQQDVVAVESGNTHENRTMAMETEQDKKEPLGIRLLCSFSLVRNIPAIVNTASGGCYTAINGIRFLSMAWIVLGHVWQLGIQVKPHPDELYAQNQHGLDELRDQFMHNVINNMSLAVETFFVLSASLVTLSFLKHLNRTEGKPGIRYMVLYYVHRYWRLTPVFAMLMMMYCVFYKYAAEGPLYDGHFIDAENCKEAWWKNMLYVSNLVKPEVACMGWTWYLANDFQFYCIVPLFVYLLYRLPIFGCVFLGLGFVGSIIPNVYIRKTGLDSGDFNYYFDVYIKPWCRFAPYAIGIALGYTMYRTKCRVNIPAWGACLGWFMSIGLTFACVFGMHDFDFGEDNTDVWVFQDSINRSLFALAVSWMVFACCAGYGSFIHRFLSWSLWVPLSRLTYVTYLFHPIFIYYYYQSRNRPMYVQEVTMLVTAVGILVITLFGSFLLSLAFEVPMLELEKILFPRQKRKKQN